MPPSSASLPVEAALPALRAALAAAPAAVLVAPPGAGKTTAVPPALLAEPWVAGGRLLLMLPRRLAARAAAERIAARMGATLGREVGYVTRLETCTSPAARIECLTEGVFLNRLLAEPDLPGVAGLLFDEVHERNLEGDLGLALARDAQGAFRPDLRLLAMSATLDSGRLSAFLGDAPVVTAEVPPHPLVIRHVPPRAGERLEETVARAVGEALAATAGSVLVFLPGVAEIERAGRALRLPEGVALARLHGSLSPAAQRAVLAPAPGRRVILATAIAESSLTVPGVAAVVDAGLARRPRFDRDTGLTRLETGRASQASATQRAGRAAREGPGLAIRLWPEGETRGRIAEEPPEILSADLAGPLLQLARWGIADPARLPFLDSPPPAAVADARARLERLGALAPDGRLTAKGERLARLPLAPPLAAMLLAGAAAGAADLAARLALLLTERGLGGESVDLEERLARLARDCPPAAARLAARWARAAEALQPVARPADSAPPTAGELLAEAFPERIARRRRRPGPRDADAAYLMAGGRGALLAAQEPLAAAEWLVVADAGGSGADARIRLAAALAPTPAWLAARTTTATRVAVEEGRVVAEQRETLGAIEVRRAPLAAPAPEAVVAALAAHLAATGLSLPEAEARALSRLRAAAAHGFEGLPPLDDGALARALAERSGPVRRLGELAVAGFAESLVPEPLRRALDRFAPAVFTTPAGTRHAVDYAAPGGPEVEVRVQALFGLAAHPQVLGGVPLTLALTSPAGRVIARTRDLPGFWRSGWAEVRRELFGRYPKHAWPEDPLAAAPALRGGAGRRS